MEAGRPGSTNIFDATLRCHKEGKFNFFMTQISFLQALPFLVPPSHSLYLSLPLPCHFLYLFTPSYLFNFVCLFAPSAFSHLYSSRHLSSFFPFFLSSFYPPPFFFAPCLAGLSHRLPINTPSSPTFFLINTPLLRILIIHLMHFFSYGRFLTSFCFIVFPSLFLSFHILL